MSSKKEPSEAGYEVGYRKPPEHTKFKPGQSGNARGRQRKSKELNKLIQAELDKTIAVQEAGRERRITKREAIVTQLINRAIKGDAKASQFVLAHLEKHREIEPFTPTDAEDAALLAAYLAPDNTEDDNGNR